MSAGRALTIRIASRNSGRRMNEEKLENSAPRSKSSPLSTKKNGMKMPRVTASSRSSRSSPLPRGHAPDHPDGERGEDRLEPELGGHARDHRNQGEVAPDADLGAGPLEALDRVREPLELGPMGEREEQQRGEHHEQAQMEDLGPRPGCARPE